MPGALRTPVGESRVASPRTWPDPQPRHCSGRLRRHGRSAICRLANPFPNKHARIRSVGHWTRRGYRHQSPAWPVSSEFAVPRDGHEAARISHRVNVSVGADTRTGIFIDQRPAADGALGLIARLGDWVRGAKVLSSPPIRRRMKPPPIPRISARASSPRCRTVRGARWVRKRRPRPSYIWWAERPDPPVGAPGQGQ